MNRLLYRPLVIRLELDPLLVARMRACGLPGWCVERLQRPVRFTPCRGGVIWDSRRYTSSADLVRELLTECAAVASKVSAECGGEHTAFGLYCLDRAAFYRQCAAIVRQYRGQLWPAEQDD